MDAGILPVKSPRRAKARLSPDIPAEARRRVAEALLDDALDLCAASSMLRWWVVSDDEDVRARARSRGFGAVTDRGDGLNEALVAAIGAVVDAGATSVTVLPVDLPLATPEDVRDLLDTGATSDVVVVPSQQDGGTNAIYLAPPDVLPPRFGAESLSAHVHAAEERGLRCSVLGIERMGLDIDTGSDVDELIRRGAPNTRTYNVCAALKRAPAG